jgi:DNA-binding PadR family transcriptional regulator
MIKIIGVCEEGAKALVDKGYIEQADEDGRVFRPTAEGRAWIRETVEESAEGSNGEGA